MIDHYGFYPPEDVIKVVSRPEPGWYLVDASPGPHRKLMTIEELKDWRFYQDLDSLDRARKRP